MNHSSFPIELERGRKWRPEPLRWCAVSKRWNRKSEAQRAGGNSFPEECSLQPRRQNDEHSVSSRMVLRDRPVSNKHTITHLHEPEFSHMTPPHFKEPRVQGQPLILTGKRKET